MLKNSLIGFILLNFINLQGILSDQIEMRNISVGAIIFAEEIDIRTHFINAINYANDNIFKNIHLKPIIRYPQFNDSSTTLEQMAHELLDENVAAIFGPSSKASTDIVASICHSFSIPNILFDFQPESSSDEKLQQSMTINIYPDLMTLAKALADIIHSYSWRSFSVIYETDEGLTKLQDVLQLLRIHYDDITMFHVKDPTDFSLIFKKIKYITVKRVIIDCQPEYAKKFLQLATEFNMTDIIYSYFFTNLDTSIVNLKQFSHIKANATGVRLKLKGADDSNENESQKTTTRTIHDGVILLSHAIEFILECNKVNKINCNLANDRNMSGKNILKHMKQIALKNETFITNTMNFNEYGDRIKFELEIYDIRNDNSWLKWNPHDGTKEIEHINHSYNVLSRSSLRGSDIIVATRLGEPYLMENEPKDGTILEGNNRYKGFSFDLIKILSDKFKFKYEIKVVPDNKHGKYDPEIKDWNGIIKELRDGRAHLGICDLTITHERKTAVEFTVPFMSLGVAILYYKVQPPAPNLFSFLDPFALEVWLYMATAYLVVSLLILVMARISRDEWTNPHPCNQNPEELENIWTLSNTTWLSMGSIMTQGCDILPRSGSLRFITSMWWFFALMMMNSYTANLAAFLTQSQMTSTIEDVKDLPEQNKIKYGTMLEGSTYNFFKESNDSLYSKMWNVMKNEKPSVFTKDNDEGVKRVLNSKGKYAFLMETTSLEYNLAKHCDLMQVGKKFSDRHYGIAMPMGVPYRSELNVEILKLAEQGEIKKLKDKWWNRTEPPCEKPHASSNSADLSIAEVGGVFLVLGAGILMAFVLGIAEFLWNVQRVAVEDKMTPMEAFKTEGLFFLKFWIKRKPAKKSSTSGDSNVSRSSQEKYESRQSSTQTSSSASSSTTSAFVNNDNKQLNHRKKPLQIVKVGWAEPELTSSLKR